MTNISITSTDVFSLASRYALIDADAATMSHTRLMLLALCARRQLPLLSVAQVEPTEHAFFLHAYADTLMLCHFAAMSYARLMFAAAF